MMFFNTLKFFLLSQVYFSLADPIIQLPNGLINGREATTFAQTHYYGFHGIPYAAPPVGDLRFKAPQPALDWDGTRDAGPMDVVCFQTANNWDSETEDCLLLSVFTPELPGEDNNVSLPVMVFIHGGGFVDGSGLGMAPDLFVDNNVVFVTINYRVGIFGFLSTQDEIIPGNNGLKDQQLALKWIHETIHLCGGNPDQITIFGQSAGSASVAYQLLNQDNNGLFQSAILQSGSFLSPWAFQRKSREIAFTTASYINSSFEGSNDSQALLDFFMTLEARDIDAAAEKYHNMEYGPHDIEISQGFYFAPVVEVKNPDGFLTKKMYGLLQAGNVVKVPIMIGVTSEENLLFNQNPDQLLSDMTTFDQNLGWIVPNDMEITDEDSRTHMGTLIRDLYTGGEPLAQHLGDAVRYCSDTSFTRSVIKHAELFSKLADTYFYIFSYDGQLANGNTHYDGAENVGHGEEMAYLFCGGTGCDDSAYPESDGVTRKRLVKLWTDFAKYQNPTPEPSDLLQNVTWPVLEVDGGDYWYLDINEDVVLMNHPKQETYDGWNQLYGSLGYDDFDTY